MSQGKGKSEGPTANLQKAFEAAWDDAKSKGGSPGKYVVTKIEIQTENPIRGYIVTIDSDG